MRIAVDIRSLLSPHGRGVSHYTSSLLQEMVKRHPQDEWVLFSTGRHRPKLPPALADQTVQRHVARSNKLMNSLLAVGAASVETYVGEVDVWFAPNLGFVRIADDTPLVVTVHDLSFDAVPQYFSAKERLWHQMVRPKALLNRANRIIAISDQTKQELVERYRLLEEKVTVVRSGIDSAYRQAIPQRERTRVRRKYGLAGEYFLYLGAIEPRKNIPVLLSAFRLARLQGLRAELALAGTGRSVKPAPGVRPLGYVDEADKPALYHDALGLVLISRHEGFGFPPLEALRCGTPSVVSDLPIFSETLGRAARRVPPGDPAAVAEALVQLASDPALRNRLVKQGTPAIKRYTWPAAGRETYRILKEAAGAR